MGSDTIYCECGQPAELVDGVEIYPHRADDMLGKLFYRCAPCGAHVGVNLSTGLPTGSLANEPTRRARRQAHEALQILVRRKRNSEGIAERRAWQLAEGWLAEKLGVSRERAKISLMNEEQALRVLHLCNFYLKGRDNGRRQGGRMAGAERAG